MILFKKILKWTGIVLASAFVILVIVRAFHFYNLDKTNEQVAKIHATKLQLSDVMGDNLPPDPGAEADKTIVGVDANRNGIRDDVELAIFEEYPDSAKTRAALLQYALALQMEMIQPIVNEETVIAVAQERSRAAFCIAGLVSRDDVENFVKVTMEYNNFVKDRQINNLKRNDAQQKFLEHIGSYSDLMGPECDLNLSTLPN